MRTPTPHLLLEDSTNPGSYLCIPGRRSRAYTREISHAIRFSRLEADLADWTLPHERFVPLEDALRSLTS
ncbi:MAG: hypothetical protein VKI63_04230 [Cyanobium sp.]|nr:hypothetical protein [Cyanobium sp.]